MNDVADFDIDAIRAAFALLRVRRHCDACEVEWSGGGSCWSCGETGRAGGLSAILFEGR